MPRYIIERSVPGLAPDALKAAGYRSNAALADMPGVKAQDLKIDLREPRRDVERAG